MTRTNATRRSFIAVAGAALSAPVAAAAATLPGQIESDPTKTRLVHLEDVNEIRALNQAYLIERRMSGVSPADFGERDVVEIAEDRLTATARVHVIVHTQTALEPDCTLVEMAQAQGEGVLRLASPAVLEITYVRRGGTWKILRTRDSRTMA